MAVHDRLGLAIQSVQSLLHVLEADVGVHVGRRGRRGVAELLLYLAQVAGLPEQVNGQRVPGAVNRKLFGQPCPLDGGLPDALQALSGRGVKPLWSRLYRPLPEAGTEIKGLSRKSREAAGCALTIWALAGRDWLQLATPCRCLP